MALLGHSACGLIPVDLDPIVPTGFHADGFAHAPSSRVHELSPGRVSALWAQPQFRMTEMLSAVLPERPSTGETLTSQQQKARTLTCFPLHPTLLFSRWSPEPYS